MLQREEIRHLAHAVARSALPVFGPQFSFPLESKSEDGALGSILLVALDLCFFWFIFFPNLFFLCLVGGLLWTQSMQQTLDTAW